MPQPKQLKQVKRDSEDNTLGQLKINRHLPDMPDDEYKKKNHLLKLKKLVMTTGQDLLKEFDIRDKYGLPVKFQMNDKRKLLYSYLFDYFLNPLEFHEKQGKINDGIAIIGSVGCGKTLALEVFNRVLQKFRAPIDVLGQKIEFKWEPIRAREINNRFSKNGFDIIEHYQKRLIVGIEDLGDEDDIVPYFGRKVTVLRDILDYRHEHKLLTFITSNDSMDDLEKRYGERIGSRFAEQFNEVVILAEDERKKNKYKTKMIV